MIRGALAVVAATVTLLLGLGSGTAHAALTEDELHAVTDEYLFDRSLGEFLEIRAAAPHWRQLDWSTDGCSWSPDQPFGYELVSACYRHDFGYRNYAGQGRFNEDTRLLIDDTFYADMLGICAGDAVCEGTAWVYHQAVRQFGAAASDAEVAEIAEVESETRAFAG